MRFYCHACKKMLQQEDVLLNTFYGLYYHEECNCFVEERADPMPLSIADIDNIERQLEGVQERLAAEKRTLSKIRQDYIALTRDGGVQCWGFSTALSNMRLGKRVRRKAWPSGEHIKIGPGGKDKITKCHYDGMSSSWQASNEDLLAADWHLAN